VAYSSASVLKKMSAPIGQKEGRTGKDMTDNKRVWVANENRSSQRHSRETKRIVESCNLLGGGTVELVTGVDDDMRGRHTLSIEHKSTFLGSGSPSLFLSPR
jgi:hypothetical protein